MTAVLSPPYLVPGLRPFRPQLVRPGTPAGRPRLVVVPSRPTVDLPRSAPTAPEASTTPTAATYRHRRLGALAALLVLVMGVAVLTASVVGVTTGRVGPGNAAAGIPTVVAATPSSVYLVHSGDTLWSIARGLQPEGDIRPLVDALTERTGSPVLRPGQRVDLDGLAL